jgi:hypothetical protein
LKRLVISALAIMPDVLLRVIETELIFKNESVYDQFCCSIGTLRPKTRRFGI